MFLNLWKCRESNKARAKSGDPKKDWNSNKNGVNKSFIGKWQIIRSNHKLSVLFAIYHFLGTRLSLGS
ncbi:hypothetical protein A2924_00535 [Candidatus Giovannonibacteria bacterium RIFCSPLOWO2_01_FULL_44_16]|uniref:Uncharacterized protein n=1 Tax=Candidatus Giovannonibacteria bacterium RIFCSPLOWO2_01_FULL_44_16 TaxID=1798348 RepID=A0A1F5X4W1_9BACT|nr:MAG: hypothetical protein A2924_00535 [Candidatus Giovannonibacteria bacterium RIFCSPLOWO2_01_FULL_44_16]